MKFIQIGVSLILILSQTGCPGINGGTGTIPKQANITPASTPTVSENSNGQSAGTMEAGYPHLSLDDTASDLVNHPAFRGFGRFMLPLEGDFIKLTDPLSTLNDAEESIGVINRMMDMEADGQTIFYDIYTDDQKQKDPSKESTGLFFFRGEPGAPFAVICAGGAFVTVDTTHESFPLSLALSEKGYNIFALKYRVGGAEIACEDLAAALMFIYKHADELQVSTENYSLWGTSAGGRVAAYLGSHGAAAYGGDDLPRASTVVMAYTGHSDYTENDPPTFVVVGDRDGIASPSVMERRVNALKNAGVDVEFHVYPNIGHAFGLGTGTSAEGWYNDAVRFWGKHLDQ